MARRHELKLRWAFVLALALHGVALAAAARLPQLQARTGELADIQVFDAAAAVVVSHVSLVEWSAPAPAPVIAPVSPSPAPDAVVTPDQPVAQALPPQPPPRVRVAPGRAPQARPGGARSPEMASVPTPQGGGGASVETGPGSQAGTAPVAGGTGPAGEVPGEGTGRGPGEGSGAGPGSGEGASPQSPGREGSGEDPGETPGTVARPPHTDRDEPEVTHQGRLAYPAAALEEGVEGTCVLRVLVGEKGEVLEVKVSRSSGDNRLDKAAVEFVRRWQYRPAVQAGQPRRVYTRATVQFALD